MKQILFCYAAADETFARQLAANVLDARPAWQIQFFPLAGNPTIGAREIARSRAILLVLSPAALALPQMRTIAEAGRRGRKLVFPLLVPPVTIPQVAQFYPDFSKIEVIDFADTRVDPLRKLVRSLTPRRLALRAALFAAITALLVVAIVATGFLSGIRRAHPTSSTVTSVIAGPSPTPTALPAPPPAILAVGTANGTLAAVRRDSGQVLWQAQLPGAVQTPLIVGRTIYATSAGGMLTAYDIASGAVQWHFAPGDTFAAPPIVSNGMVYVGGASGNLYAVDAATGTVRWQQQTSGALHAAPVDTTVGSICVGAANGMVMAYQSDNGTPLWSFAAGSAINVPPIVFGGDLFIGASAGDFYALMTNGKQLVHYRTDGTIVAPLAAFQLGVYVATTHGIVDDFGSINGFQLQWASLPTAAIVAAPTVDQGNDTTIGTTTGLVAAYGIVISPQAETQMKPRWTAHVAGAIRGAVAVPGASDTTTDIVGTDQGILYGIAHNDGTVLWHLSLGGTIVTAPIAINTTVFVGNTDGHLRAFDLTGKQLWDVSLGGPIQTNFAANA